MECVNDNFAQRKGDIADSETDDLCAFLGICFFIGSSSVCNLGEQIAGLQIEIIFI